MSTNKLLHPTTPTTCNASLCSSLCSTRMLWTSHDGSSTNDASPNDATNDAGMCSSMRPTRMLWTSYDASSTPNDAILPSSMCPSMLRSTTTSTNASLSTSLCSNGMLCTSHASYATTIMHAIVCTKLLHGKEIDHYNKQKI